MNPKTRRRVLLGGAALLLAILGTFGLLRTAHFETTAPPPTGLPFELLWRPGTSQQYRVVVDSTFRMETSSVDPAQSLRVHLAGALDMRTLEERDGQVLVGMRLSTVQLKVGGRSDTQANLALASPFRVWFASGGLPAAFEFPAAVAAEHRDMLENLVRMFQVAMGKGPTWLVREANASGTYEASYLRTTPTTMEKKKRRFIDASPTSADALADIASTESIRLDTGRDWIAAMRVDEVLRTRGQDGPAVEVTNHASLELRSESLAMVPAEPEAWAFVAAAAPARATPGERAGPARSHAQARAMLVEGIAELDAAPEGRSVLIHRLRDLIRGDGTLAAVLLESIKTRQLSDRTRADLYLVFELAGSPPAQAALRSVLTDASWSQHDAMRAIVALGGVARPGEDTVSALWNTARSGHAGMDGGTLAGTAALALGSLGNRLNAARDSSYPSLRSGLLNGALSGGDSRQRATYVHAIGNTGDASLTGDIVPLLDDADPRLRSAAAQSLGRLGSSDVADALLRRLQLERNDVVRGSIAEALASWKSPTAPAVDWVRAAIRSERDENARYHMARVLGTSLSAHPVNAGALQDVQRFEPSRRIRHYIAGALATAN